MNGPDDICLPDCQEVRFGALPMPPGYSVWWHEEHEHYQGHGPDGAASDIHVNRFACRRWCVEHAARAVRVREAIRVLTEHFAALHRRDPEALLLDRVLGRAHRGEVEKREEALSRALAEERAKSWPRSIDGGAS